MAEKIKGWLSGGLIALVMALILTGIWLYAAYVLLRGAKPCGGSEVFWCLQANELGDTLAGVFAPLAFIWVVAAVFIQYFELKAQRREMQDTREVQLITSNLLNLQTTIEIEREKSRMQEEAARNVKPLLEGYVDGLQTLFSHYDLVTLDGEPAMHVGPFEQTKPLRIIQEATARLNSAMDVGIRGNRALSTNHREAMEHYRRHAWSIMEAVSKTGNPYINELGLIEMSYLWAALSAVLAGDPAIRHKTPFSEPSPDQQQ